MQDQDIAFKMFLQDTGHNTWWRHQMEEFSALLAICAGNSPVPGVFPQQRPVTRSAHYDVIVIGMLEDTFTT